MSHRKETYHKHAT